MKNYQNDFDYFCVGSDQIWNPGVVQNNDFFFLNFAPPEKTFSFAASMGTTYIPEQYKNTYMTGLSKIGFLSVRENDVKEFIQKLINRNSTVLLDPTLLIDKSEWCLIQKKPDFELPEKYIATYFLSSTTPSQDEYISKYAEQNNLKIINMNKEYYDKVGPSEFVYLIANADFVFTDSFHGTAL